jgi:hypothetical protein
MWNLCLGPNSPLPGERLEIVILDETGKVVRRLEQVRGLCRDEGYVDFFLGPNCRPAVHDFPLVDIDADGQVAAIVHPNYSQDLGQELYLRLVKAWAEKWGRAEYAL